MGRIIAEALPERASELLDFDIDTFKERGRLYGKDKRKRDVLAFYLWEKGADTDSKTVNSKLDGITYSAVRHIIKQVKGRLKTEPDFEKDYRQINWVRLFWITQKRHK